MHDVSARFGVRRAIRPRAGTSRRSAPGLGAMQCGGGNKTTGPTPPPGTPPVPAAPSPPGPTRPTPPPTSADICRRRRHRDCDALDPARQTGNGCSTGSAASVFALGDNTYFDRHGPGIPRLLRARRGAGSKGRTFPVPGNHDYDNRRRRAALLRLLRDECRDRQGSITTATRWARTGTRSRSTATFRPLKNRRRVNG